MKYGHVPLFFELKLQWFYKLVDILNIISNPDCV